MNIKKLIEKIILFLIFILLIPLYLILSFAFGKIIVYPIIIGITLLSLTENRIFIEKLSNIEIKSKIRKMLKN